MQTPQITINIDNYNHNIVTGAIFYKSPVYLEFALEHRLTIIIDVNLNRYFFPKLGQFVCNNL